ncbi:MAG: dihydroneopterin aldolase [Fluviicola sp.]|jgi:dihydroneopterin aldolase
MKHRIEVNNIRLYAYHGCLPEEGKIGGNYSVDVHVRTDFSAAAISDELSQTIDYVAINAIVHQEMAIRSKLIEHVGQRIVNRLTNEIPTIQEFWVKITKICPPINGDVENVAIIIASDNW